MKKVKYGSVLVVDDDPAVLDSSSLLLKEFGYDVVSSKSAREAVEMFQTNNIDTVITDIVMPSVSGIELLRQIHDINPSTPVILMTAYADMEKVIGAIKIGAFDFIIKPFNAELLVHSVEKAVHYNRLMLMERDYKRLLEEYNQEIETLVAERTMSLMALTIADKIRNPASVIGLTCKRILGKEDFPEKFKPKIDDIIVEAEKLDGIVRDFQSLLKSKKTMFHYEDINTVMEGVVPIVENMIARKGISLTLKPSEHPLKVNIQKNLFQIAISHLIKNASDATPEGGEITIAIHEGGDHTIIEVSDKGYGISEKDIGKVFDPIFSSKEKRFGMGLPLVKRIVAEHMGEISVESTNGDCTTFRIKLPLRWTGGK